MKRSINYIVFFLGVVFFFSCYEERLDIEPYGELSAGKLFSNQDGAEAAMIGVYKMFSCGGWYMYGAWGVDYYGNPGVRGAGNSDAAALDNLDVTPANNITNRVWNSCYKQIGRVNSLLFNMTETTFDDPQRKTNLEAEARFIRAYNYFLLVQTYGDVPLITSVEDDLYPLREGSAKVYEKIISDLQFCLTGLTDDFPVNVIENNDIPEIARPTTWAAKGLLAKVLLAAPEPIKDPERAAGLTNDIITNGPFELETYYGDLFLTTNKDNPENIYLISLAAQSQMGSNVATHTTPSDAWHRPSDSLYNSYEAGDTRRNVNIQFFLGRYFVKKLRHDPNVHLEMCANNFPLYGLRLADVILLRAEALTQWNFEANKAEIIAMLNLIRERAFQDNLHNYQSADINSKAEAIEIIRIERHKELFYECHLFFDLKRLGVAKQVYNCEDYELLWPIPTEAITDNPKLIQNIGY